MRSSLALLAAGAGIFLLGSAAPPPHVPRPQPMFALLHRAGVPAAVEILPAASIQAQVNAIQPAEAVPPPPPTPELALRDGVLIVVSLPSQRIFVFRNGEAWGSSKVSTGRRGHETPPGAFPILQKKVHHRSSLYNDAPMPYMQRLTWGGIALHAGKLPGYPASHGCIRLPTSFAKDLYRITDFSSSVVVVTDEPLASAAEARLLV